MDPSKQQELRQRLSRLYGDQEANEAARKIDAIVGRYRDIKRPPKTGWDEKDVWLITYGDSLLHESTPPLKTLHKFLEQNVGELVSFVHILPFYPYSSDDGFAVVDYREVNPDLGSWDHIAELGRTYRLVFDAVINHASASSGYMKGFCERDPRHADFFMAFSPDTDLSSVVRPRALPLLHEYETSHGARWLWTTFSRDQIDLNYANPSVLAEIVDVLLHYVSRGASAIRLDAIAYLWKEVGTRCINLPQAHEVVKLFRTVFDMAAPETLILTETNVPHDENLSYFGNGADEAQLVYNFSLSPLILFSLHTGNAQKLTSWAKTIKPVSDKTTFLNFTASHDGIGVRPTEGILNDEERGELVALARAHGGAVSSKRDADGSQSPYEFNVNYFDAVNNPGEDEPPMVQVARFLVSQAIPLSFIGIPATYIHSLLGSRNDYEGVKNTGRARSINREKLNVSTVLEELGRADSLRSRVFNAYKRMLKIRRLQPAFHPNAEQQVCDLGPAVFGVRRHNPRTGDTVIALHNVTTGAVSVKPGLNRPCVDVLHESETFSAHTQAVPLGPYQVRWLKEQR